jgi:hypothetical protein
MNVLLLNASFQPLDVISRQKLIVLLTKDRITFVDEATRLLVQAEIDARRLGQDVVVVRLLKNIRIPRRLLYPNRRNLLLRDEHTCQYCGVRGSGSELTVDHIIPVSRGGANSTWENQVIACRRCNHLKSNHLLREVNMRLRCVPQPLTGEYAQLLFLRHPKIKTVYDQLLNSALTV